MVESHRKEVLKVEVQKKEKPKLPDKIADPAVLLIIQELENTFLQ